VNGPLGAWDALPPPSIAITRGASSRRPRRVSPLPRPASPPGGAAGRLFSAGMRPAAVRPAVVVTEPLRHRRQDRCAGLRGPGPREGATPGVAQCRHPPGPRLPSYALPGDNRRLGGHRVSPARPPRLPRRAHPSLPARPPSGNGPTSPVRCGPRSSALCGPGRATLMSWRLRSLGAHRPHARPTSR
jgi:hypothetical protein